MNENQKTPEVVNQKPIFNSTDALIRAETEGITTEEADALWYSGLWKELQGSWQQWGYHYTPENEEEALPYRVGKF